METTNKVNGINFSNNPDGTSNFPTFDFEELTRNAVEKTPAEIKAEEEAAAKGTNKSKATPASKLENAVQEGNNQDPTKQGNVVLDIDIDSILAGKSVFKKEEGKENREEEEEEEESEVLTEKELQAKKAKDLEEAKKAKQDEGATTPEQAQEIFQTYIDLGILNLPEDFKFDGTEEGLQKAIALDNELRMEAVTEDLKNQIKDPRVFELIDHGVKGGQFADLNKLFAIQQREIDLEKIDTSKDDQAKQVIEKQLSASGLSSKRIASTIEVLEDKGELKDAADEALATLKEAAGKEKKNVQAFAEKQNKQAKQNQERYEHEFLSAVDEAGYLPAKKQQILNTFQPIKFNDGSEMTNYQYKYQLISSNPKDFLKLVEIISDYDPKKGFSTKREGDAATTVSSKSLLDKLKKHGTTKAKGEAGGAPDKQLFAQNPLNGRVKIL